MKRPILSSTLLLSLAGIGVAGAWESDLPIAQRGMAEVEQSNRLAAVPMIREPAQAGGVVLLRRTEPVVRPPTPEELEAKVARVAGDIVQNREKAILAAAAEAAAHQTAMVAAQTGQQLATSEERLKAYSEALARTVAAQTQAYAEQNTQATAEQLKDFATRIAAQKATEAEQKAAEEALTLAKQAETRSKAFVVGELATRESITAARLGEIAAQAGASEARTQALLESTAARLAALTETNTTRLAAQQQVLAAQLSAQQQVAAESSSAKLETLAATSAAYWDTTQRQLQTMQGQTVQALQDVRANMTATNEQTKEYARLAALEAQLKAQEQAITTARTEAMAAETRAKTYTGEHIAARNEVLGAKLEVLQAVTSAKLDAAETVSAMRNAQTLQRLEDLEQLTASNQRLMQAESRRMAKVLSEYTDSQLAQLSQTTEATLARVAAAAQMDVESLRQNTANKLKAYRKAAEVKAESLTQAIAEKLEARMREAQTEAETKRLKPADVKELAKQTLQESAPELRALALQTLADSQDYIRTVASNAVKDGDPDMKLALTEAARDVITKDSQVVFAMRKVADKQLEKRLSELQAPQPTRDGQGRPTIYNGDEISLDGKRLGVAPIGANMAEIEPAAGEQRIAGLTKPSMMRARQRVDWIDLRKYRVIVHQDGKTLPQLITDVMANAEPYTGPWEVKWKIGNENKDILTEKFSLDAETTFEEFVNYLANYMVNARGVKLSFSLFDSERVLVISD